MGKKITAYQVFQEMAERDLDIDIGTDVLGIQQDNKRGGSRVTMGIRGDNLTHCFAQGSHSFVLVVYNRRNYTETLADMEKEHTHTVKPIRVFYNELDGRLYAARGYKELPGGAIEITGQKFDVTDEIAGIVRSHKSLFQERGN